MFYLVCLVSYNFLIQLIRWAIFIPPLNNYEIIEIKNKINFEFQTVLNITD